MLLDEINIALYYKLISKTRLITLLKNKPIDLEIVLTGRYADNEILNLSDLVTEMKEIKHYYTKGVLARKGIEK